jgi:hypothetical protein
MPPLPRWGEVDGGAAEDGGVDRGTTRDGAHEQPGMRCGCASCGKQPCATALEKASTFFFEDTEAECGHKIVSGVRVRGVRRDGRPHPIISAPDMPGKWSSTSL